MTTTALATAIETALSAHACPDRAAGAKRYLKSELDFLGLRTALLRRELRRCVADVAPLSRSDLLATVGALWCRGVFELRATAVELLRDHVSILEASDLQLVEDLLRDAHTWALVDGLAPHIASPLIERFPGLAPTLDRWATDNDFWLRRAALLVHLIPLRRGQGDFERFSRLAEPMLSETEFFIRKAIGWILRDTAKKRPQLVIDWLEPRLHLASGLTVREAVKHLPEPDRTRLLDAFRHQH